LGMPHKFEVANLLSVEQAIPARAATGTLCESESLIEADRVHTDTGQLRSLSDVQHLCHVYKNKPWSYVQSQERIGMNYVCARPGVFLNGCSWRWEDKNKIRARKGWLGFCCCSPASAKKASRRP